MKLSVIIVNFNQKYFPRLCTEALKKNMTDFDYEIIFVDNNSHDESINYLRDIAADNQITLIESPENLGYGKGNNLGVKRAKGEYVLIINPDIILEESGLQRLVDYMDRNKNVGVMGPKLTYADGKVQESCRRNMTFFDLIVKRTFFRNIPFFKKRLRRYLMEDFDHLKEREVDLLCGACFIFPKKVYDQVCGFDKRYFLFMEDFDICREIRKRGYKVMYYPQINVLHNHKRLSDGSLSKLIFKKIFWIHISSAIKYFLKWGINR